MAVHQLSLSLLVVVVIAISRCSAEVVCVKNHDCKCTLDDGTKRYFDLSEISSKDGPYFNLGQPGSQDYYDPCEPFTIEDSNGVCNGVAGCHNDLENEEQTYSHIAVHKRVNFDYNEAGENLVLFYDNGKLLCMTYNTYTVHGGWFNYNLTG